MSLANERMNAVFAFSAGVFGRRAELAIKSMPSAACIADTGVLTDIVLELRGERFARNQDDQICLVLEVGLRAELGGQIVTTPGNLWFIITAEARRDRRSNIDISLEYDQFQLTIPPPEGVQEQVDNTIRALLQEWLDEIVSIPLQALLGNRMELVGEPELTIGGDVNGSLRTLAIGLEIDLGTVVDRNHFRSVYVPPRTGAPVNDFFLLIESELMEIRIRQDFRALNLGDMVEGWGLTFRRRAFWMGNGRNEDFKGGWRDYLDENWREHPVWLHAEGQMEIRFLGERGVYWHAYADIGIQNIEVQGEILERLVLDPYIFEADLLSGFGSFFLPAQERDLEPIDLGSTLLDSGLLITAVDSTSELFQVRGWDTNPGLPGLPRIGVSSTDVAVEFGYEQIGPDPLCSRYRNYGELEGEAVISHFDIYNRDQATLWVCAVALEADPDNVFEVRPQRPLPWGLGPGDSMPVDVLLRVRPNDHAEHWGTITIRSNDFDSPRVSVAVYGFKEREPRELDFCSRFDLPQILPERLQELLNLPILEFEDLIGRKLSELPPIPDPEPPCPECGYYIDLAFAGLSREVSIEVQDAEGNLIDRSQVINNVHTFSAPIDPERNLRIVTAPNIGGGKIEMSLRISQVERVGLYYAHDRILGLATERGFVFGRFEDGIGVVIISDPANPREVNRVALEKCNAIYTRNGHLYALTDSSLEIFDIHDPYNLSLVHRISVAAGSTIEFDRNRLILLDGGKLTVYQISLPMRGTYRPTWLQELRAKDPIESIVRTQHNYILATEKGAYILSSLEEEELSRAKLVPLDKLTRNLLGASAAKRGPTITKQLVLQDDYVLRIFDNRRGFEILEKSRVPFSGRKEALEDFFLERNGKQRHSSKTDRKYGRQS